MFEFFKSGLRFLSAKIKTEDLNCDKNGIYTSKTLLGLWIDVLKVEAYKIDEITTDLVVIEIILVSGRVITIHEEMPGFECIAKCINTALVSVKPDWERNVVSVPFEENRMTIYEKI